MIDVTLVVREPGRLKPDFSLPFKLPTLPRENDYISVTRPDTPDLWSEDLIVRKVWWRLFHPETGGFSHGDPQVGKVTEIIVECDPAIGPHSSDQWLASLSGSQVETFEVERYSIRQSEMGS